MRKIALIALAAAMAGAAHALIIPVQLVSVGQYSFDGSGNYLTAEDVVYQDTAGLADFNTLDYICQNFVGGLGTATFDDGAGNMLVLDVQVNDAVSQTNAVSADGYWVYDHGTGDYAGLAGTGTYSQSFHTRHSFASSTFVGDLEAVPEPASMLALGIGALGLLRRRDRR